MDDTTYQMEDATYEIRRRELLLKLSPLNTSESAYPNIELERGMSADQGDVYRARVEYVEIFVHHHNWLCQLEKRGDFEEAALERTKAISALEKAVNATPENTKKQYVIRGETIFLRKDGTPSDATSSCDEYDSSRWGEIYTSPSEAANAAILKNVKETSWCGKRKNYFVVQRRQGDK